MSRRAVRLLTAALLVGLFLALSATVAEATDLEDLLADAANANYAGEQATWCSFSGRTEFSVVTVEHSSSLLMVESAGSSQVLGGGRASAVGSGNGVALSEWSSVAVDDRYTTSDRQYEVRSGRDVIVVSVNEQDRLRARIWFDEDTGAALGSEIYDNEGDLFRLSWMLDFDPNPRRIYTFSQQGAATYDVVVEAEADVLADNVAGYQRVDTYAGPSDSIHAFYSDGLFSFSVFLIDGEGATGPFVDADIMETDGGTYRWMLTPSDLWVQWSGDGVTYVLAGDLPPDHLEEVLAELPSPTQANLLSRIWKGIFG